MTRMTVRFRRGPKAGETEVLQGTVADLGIIEVAGAEVPRYSDLDDVYAQPLRMKRGSYRLTNQRTKRGVYIYEWMGWYGEVLSH